ncbi:hypothetical protein LINPERHAP2_LOCUS5786 [Linum perenne]
MLPNSSKRLISARFLRETVLTSCIFLDGWPPVLLPSCYGFNVQLGMLVLCVILWGGARWILRGTLLKSSLLLINVKFLHETVVPLLRTSDILWTVFPS